MNRTGTEKNRQGGDRERQNVYYAGLDTSDAKIKITKMARTGYPAEPNSCERNFPPVLVNLSC